MNKRKEECNNHVSRMTEDKIVRAVPICRSTGKAGRRWIVSFPLHKQAASLCTKKKKKKIKVKFSPCLAN
jgi:hypothetical protein